ncbi:MAG: hypothetical protein QW186_06030 [Candidatus Bathyarchaeia archaeon]
MRGVRDEIYDFDGGWSAIEGANLRNTLCVREIKEMPAKINLTITLSV